MRAQAAPPAEAHVETEMAALASRFINSTNRHVFLTGKAGTGKTTFLHRLAASTHKRYVILAPTGIAALNAGGVTIHSQFLLPFGAFLPERQRPLDIPEGPFHDQDTLTRRHPLNAVRRHVLREADLLIIDEVSMLRADVLDAIDFRMRAVRQDRYRSFGGAQVLLIGDLHQLPPVVKDEEWRVMQRYYASMHFFEAQVIKQHGYAHIELDRIFRQQDDRFIRILNNLRDNRMQPEDADELNRHYREAMGAEEREGIITLATHNHQADSLNRSALDALPGEAFRYEAEVEGEFPQGMRPLPDAIELKEGAQVMFVKNDPEKAYVNGMLARVEALDRHGITVRLLQGPGSGPAARSFRLKRERWEHKRYVVDPATKEQQEEVLGTFEHYPIRLAWAITVHKSQGLTFDRAIIDVGRAFAPGQVYVALSRLRSLDGLILRTRIDPRAVTSDPEVVAFNERGAGQEPLPRQLEAGQGAYLRELLSGTFDLSGVQRRAEWARKDHPETDLFEDESMRAALPALLDALRAEEGNTQRFRNQLMRLLAEGKREELSERIAKGAAYYSALLWERMEALFRHLAQAELLSGTKAYAGALKEIDGMLMKQLATMAKAGRIAASILSGEEVLKQEDQEHGLAMKRAAMVGAARAWALENRPQAAGKTGKRRKRRKEAEQGEGEPAAGQQPKGTTYAKTYALAKEGLGIAEIAAQRGMARSTIEGHLARGIAEGVLDIGALMPDEERDLIADWMRENPREGLNGAAGHFEGRFGYGQLRMVQAWLKHG